MAKNKRILAENQFDEYNIDMRTHEQYRKDVADFLIKNKGEDYLQKFVDGKKPVPCELLQKRWEEVLQETWRTNGKPNKRDLALTIIDTHHLLSPFAKHKRIPREIVQLVMTLQTYVYAHADEGTTKPFESIIVHLCEFAYGVPDGKFLPTMAELEQQFDKYIK